MDDAEIIGAEAAEPEPMDMDEMRIMALEEDFTIATELMDEQHMLDMSNFIFFCARYLQAKAGNYNIHWRSHVNQWHIDFCNDMCITLEDLLHSVPEAWRALENMSRERAMTEFMEEMDDINPEWRSLLDARRSSATGLGHRVSNMLAEEEEELSDHEVSIFDWCKEGNVEEVRRLLSRENANIDQVDENGRTLLHHACDRGHPEVVNLLIERRVNMNALDPNSQTPLHYACACDQVPVIKLLVRHGSNVNARDKEGKTPADHATRENIRQLLGLQ